MSKIRANKLEHISTSNGGVELDNAGHVTVDGLQMPTIGPLSNRNLVGNGALNVAQRGTSNVTTTGYQTVDRFQTGASGGTFSQERIDLTSSDTPFSSGFRHAYRVKNDVAASASNHYRQFETRIEAQDVVNSGWDYNNTSSYITVSFWARASVAGTYTFDFRTQDSPAQAYPTSITLAADTWKKFELTYPGDSSIVINDDNGAGLRLVWGIYFGDSYTDSNAVMDAWHAFSSLNIAPDDTAGWGTTTNATFDVTGVQCEVGEKATPFEHKTFNQDLNDCLRYYEKSYDYGTAPGTATTAGMIAHRKSSNSSVITDFNLMYRHKRAHPTIVMYNPDTGGSGVISNNGSNATASASDIGQNNSRVITSSTLGADIFVKCHYTADAEL